MEHERGSGLTLAPMKKKRGQHQQHAIPGSQKRVTGTRIKRGLDELYNLDAVPQQQSQESQPSPGRVSKCNDRGKGKSSKASSTAENPLMRSAVQGISTNGEKTAVSVAQRKEDDGPIVATAIIKMADTSEYCGSSPPTVFGYNWEEWKSVKQHLFNPTETAGSAAARRKALDHIELVWKARAREGRPLPSYVESTAMLLEAVSLDESNKMSSIAITALYGAVISRAVHVMTGEFARGADDTYRKRAQAIGFPEEAVEVRQRVSHGALPLLTELRWVCGLVLQFLFHNYWLEQERHLHCMEQEEKEAEVEVEKVNKNTRDAHKVVSNHATVEEMRWLLDALSDDCEEDEDTPGGDSCEECTNDGFHDADTIRVGDWTLS
ncbi:Las1-like, putative [Trypanosoma equiperdum]|uniref:Las1-like n=2 Tax=Trypanozoon TaxID=39700 RepID=Q57YI3_TRYB2|nr:hypothetical protein, conserved [Trypanosoma brucei brucei TREU927]AAX69328.1 hypothetical protein, conserved [Trypanosoma brucei]AAZ13346.1 hypothetical protein, conserved [Trypanosoma brucei brucei TREU927]SCU65523.1 Las1-like, putative [Trypanosoma equiperdum]